MEKFLNPYDKECMRMAMLKQEETFREQVYELHRLYQIQKILMKNIASNRHITQTQMNNSKKTVQGFDLERPTEEYNAERDYDGDEMEEMVEKNDLELTLGPSSFYKQRSKKAGPPLASKSELSFSSSSTVSNHHLKRTSFIPHQKMNTVRDHHQESSQKWISNPTFLGESKKSSDIEEHLRQDRVLNNSPWLFQVLI